MRWLLVGERDYQQPVAESGFHFLASGVCCRTRGLRPCVRPGMPSKGELPRPYLRMLRLKAPVKLTVWSSQVAVQRDTHLQRKLPHENSSWVRLSCTERSL